MVYFFSRFILLPHRCHTEKKGINKPTNKQTNKQKETKKEVAKKEKSGLKFQNETLNLYSRKWLSLINLITFDHIWYKKSILLYEKKYILFGMYHVTNIFLAIF